MNTKKQVLLNAAAQALGKFASIAASFIVVKIITGIGQEFYGNYVTTYEYLAFFGILADAGLFAIGVREISKNPDKTQKILGNILSMRLGFIIIATVLAGTSAQFVYSYPPQVQAGIWITGLSMALTIVAGTLNSVLQARFQVYYFSLALFLSRLILAILVFAITQHAQLFGDNLFFTLLWAGVIANFCFVVVTAFFASRITPLRLFFDFTWWRHTLRESLPYGLALILQTLYLRIDLIIISLILGTASVGVYGIPARILDSLLVIGVFFGQAFLPKISQDEKDPEEVGHSIVWAMEKLLIISLPMILGLIHFATDIVLLLSNTQYLTTPDTIGADALVVILMPTIFFAYFNQLFSYSLIAKRKQNYLLWVNGIALALNAGLNIYFLEQYGVIAAAVSTVVCELIVFFLLSRQIALHFTLPFRKKQLGAIFIANAVLFVQIYLTPLGSNLILAIAVGSFTYFGLLALMLGRDVFKKSI